MSYQKIGDIVLVKSDNYVVSTKYRILALVYKTNLNILRINQYKILDKKECEPSILNLSLKKYALNYAEFNTVHIENNLKYYVGISKMYFSGKYATYRLFLKDQILNKKIIVMFNGSGPYAVILSKNNKCVVGVDVNYIACQYFEINCKINKVYNCTSIKSDVLDFIKLNQETDVLITVLPSLFTKFWPYLDKIMYLQHFALILIYLDQLNKILYFFEVYYNKKPQFKLIRSYSKYSAIFSLKLTKKIRNQLN